MESTLIAIATVCGLLSLLMHYIGSRGLGEIDEAYHRVWWWDLVAHTVVSVPIALSALTVGLFFFQDPWVIIATGTALTMTVGVLWEVYENVYWGEEESGRLLYPEDTALDLLTEYAVSFTLSVLYVFA